MPRSALTRSAVYQKQLVTNLLHRLELELSDLGQRRSADAIANRGCRAPAENFGANREMKFIDQVVAEEGVVDLTAAFAQQPLYIPFFAQPSKRRAKIDLAAAEGFYLGPERAEQMQSPLARAFGRKNDNG